MKRLLILLAFSSIAAAQATFSPTGGSYAGTQTVTITCPTGLQCFYTTDGSTPSIAGKLYSAPIIVNTTTTLKVITAKVGVMSRNVGATSTNWKCVTSTAHTYGSLSCQTGGGIGSIVPSNVVWNYGSPMTELMSTTSSTGSTQMLFVNSATSTACSDCTQLTQDKIVQVDKGPSCLLNNEMDSNVNMLATYNQFHTASLQCNQQSGTLQWQIDNQQGSWVNTGITFGCPLSTTQQTEIRYSMHWTNGDHGCAGGFSCDSYDTLTICVGGTLGTGGVCHDYNLGPRILAGYTEPGFSQKLVLQDQPDMTNTTTCGANPATSTRSVWQDNATLSYYGTSTISSATYTIGPLTPVPAIRWGGDTIQFGGTSFKTN
jgi:hypothetical protein